MSQHLSGKSILVTGAGSGFGREISLQAAAKGARVVVSDISAEGIDQTLEIIREGGGDAVGVTADVTEVDDLRNAVATGVETFGSLEVLVNNAGVMPLSFFSDHDKAVGKWTQCIDINIKGVTNGIAAVYDQMISQGRGHVVNVASIYANAGTFGSGVYSATKAAVETLSNSLRVEAKGAIKVTTVKPTGVPGTSLLAGIINPDAPTGIVGHRAQVYAQRNAEYEAGTLDPEYLDPNSIKYWMLAPHELAAAVVYAIDQPWGISLSDITVRASGDDYVI